MNSFESANGLKFINYIKFWKINCIGLSQQYSLIQTLIWLLVFFSFSFTNISFLKSNTIFSDTMSGSWSVCYLLGCIPNMNWWYDVREIYNYNSYFWTETTRGFLALGLFFVFISSVGSFGMVVSSFMPSVHIFRKQTFSSYS